MRPILFLKLNIILVGLILVSCRNSNKLTQASTIIENQETAYGIPCCGSSGMEQISDSSYVLVYDLKSHQNGSRLGLLEVSEEMIKVQPIKVESWRDERIANDLESISAVPGRKNEFLVAESGDWQGVQGRIFHIEIDFIEMTAVVLNTLPIPLLHKNDFGLVGDQYEAIHCVDYSNDEKIIIAIERGGSSFSPEAKIRWGTWNIERNTWTIDKSGMEGVAVIAPGQWTNLDEKRNITDVHVDENGVIWAAASEDGGDTGPFYSVIYKLGVINERNNEVPIAIGANLQIGKEINGFKIEALSGPVKNIDATHAFGTEDETYGGVWRPIKVDVEDSQEPITIFLVRHAEKVKDTDDPILSAEGQSRALELSELLKNSGIEHIHSSDYNRTLQTAQPLAQELSISPELYDPRDLESLMKKIRETGGVHLVVGHSNTTPKLVSLLGGNPHSEIDEEKEYDRLYYISISAEGNISSLLIRYGSPYIPE